MHEVLKETVIFVKLDLPNLPTQRSLVFNYGFVTITKKKNIYY